MDTVERELTGATGDSIARARAFAGYVADAGDVDPEAAGSEPIDTAGIARSLQGYLVAINAAIDLLDVRDGGESAPMGLDGRGSLRRFVHGHRPALSHRSADPGEAVDPEADVLILKFEIDAEYRHTSMSPRSRRRSRTPTRGNSTSSTHAPTAGRRSRSAGSV